MRDAFFDLETHSRVNLKTDGSHKYARNCEVMIFAFADGEDTIHVWDLVNSELHWEDELIGVWASMQVTGVPGRLTELLSDEDVLWWAHNSGQFDFPVLDNQMPGVAALMAPVRRRDTMVQAFAHALPGALDKLGNTLNLDDDKRKMKEGKQLVQLFCKPQNEAFIAKYGTDRATKQTHPVEWMRFIQYAGGDIVTMREARRRLPQWNYSTPKQIELCLLDWKINARGFQVDVELARAAVAGADKAKASLAKRTKEITEDVVGATTQRDVLLAYVLAAHGVELPDMQADTLERRIADPDLPEAVRELLKNRLQASMNSVSKFKTLLRCVCDDERLRGCMQFRGAGRTGRWAHRLFQPGNLPRATLSHKLVEFAIQALKADDVDLIDLVLGNVMHAISNTIRGAIVAPKGKKLVIADLANIEGRVAAWLAGEDWKLQAFRDYDTVIGKDAKGKDIRKGWDLYILAYANSFNVPPENVPPKGNERQIGKVEELMFQYGGGVGAWITGAATYGIDLDAMTEAVHSTIPAWALKEAEDFLQWLYKKVDGKHEKHVSALAKKHDGDLPQAEHDKLLRQWQEEKTKARYGLTEKVFITCDAIKRLWRRAHPEISSYWKELEDAVRFAIQNQGVTVDCRMLKVRRKGGWLRIGLPSGRCLCYPEPKVEENGEITYTGLNQYTRQWGRVKTYGGKLFENVVQAGACDQFAESMPAIEAAGFELVLGVHDEWVAEAPAGRDDLSSDLLSELMCMDLGWNKGLPLAAAGFESIRYRKE